MNGALARAKDLLRRWLFDGEILRLMSLAVLSKPIGLITQMLLAAYFGAGASYDAYILSFFIVNFFANILGRVFSAVGVPFILELKRKLAPQEVNGFLVTIILVFIVPMVILAGIFTIVPGMAVSAGAPGAPGETRALTVAMLRIMALPGVLVLLVELLKAVLNLNHRYRIVTAMPIVNSVTTLGAILIGHRVLGIWALPIAFMVSYALQAGCLFGYALKLRLIVIAVPRTTSAYLLALWTRSWQMLVATIILVLNTFVEKAFASSLAPGSVSSIAYARALEGFGMQVFALSLVNVIYTRSSELIADGRIDACDAYVDNNLKRLIRLSVAVCLAVAVASWEVVRVLYQRNAFTADDTTRTAAVLCVYMVGLPAFLANFIIANLFHSLSRFRDKIWLSVQFIGTNVLGNVILMGPLQVVGLAISSTVSINLHLLLSLWCLDRYKAGIGARRYTRTIVTYYALGGLAWLIYEAVGHYVLPAKVEGCSRAYAVAAGAAKGVLAIGIYIALNLAQRGLRQWGGKR